MGDLAERISAAKKQVEGLKSTLNKTRQQKRDGFESLEDIATGKKSSLGQVPKVRRVLKVCLFAYSNCFYFMHRNIVLISQNIF